MMHNMAEVIQALDKLINFLQKKKDTFQDKPINKHSYFNNYPELSIDDLIDIPKYLKHKIQNRVYEYPKDILDNEGYIAEKIETCMHLLEKSLNHYNELNHFYSYTITINWVDKYLHQSMEWEHIPEEVLPTTLRSRLAKQKRSIDRLYKSSNSLDEKVLLINQAYDTAEKLPTVHEDLTDALELVQKTKNDIQKIAEESIEIKQNLSNVLTISKSKSDDDLSELKSTKEKINQILKECEEFKQKSAEAYQITNTNGLAGAFKERNKSLNLQSIFWTIGLILSLFALWYIGSGQIRALRQLLGQQDFSNAILIFQIIIAILSISAPLWFAWLATMQIQKLFKLSEDYGFKSSVSQSYEGYRKETSDISVELLEELMASLLKIINEEPLRLVKDEPTPNSPFTGLLKEIIQKREDKKDNVNKTSAESMKQSEVKNNIDSKNDDNETETEN